MRFILRVILLGMACAAVVTGCQTARAIRTTTTPQGTVIIDEINVKSLLSTIDNGVYSNGNGMTLSVSKATPDQQSIKLLADGVVSMGKLFAAQQTNGTVQSITVTNVIQLPNK